jgi:hypothetical protein
MAQKLVLVLHGLVKKTENAQITKTPIKSEHKKDKGGAKTKNNSDTNNGTLIISFKN